MTLSSSAGPMLEIRELGLAFGGIVALDDVSMAVHAGQIVGLIGPNGAGKTTLFNCLSRLQQPDRGDIRFEGASLLGRRSHRLAETGIGRTFQNLALYRELSVRDNVRAGRHVRSRGSLLADALGLPSARGAELQIDAAAGVLLARLGLEAVAERPAGSLPFATQKRVELARALAAEPRLLLLDEPAGGLNHGEVLALGGLLRGLRDEHGITLLIVEHHMGLVMSLCERVVVLDFGRKIAEGAPAQVQRNPTVIEAYLGRTRRAGDAARP